MILVDTSVLIDLFKGNDNAVVRDFKEIIQQGVPFGIASVIYQEVLMLEAKAHTKYNVHPDHLVFYRKGHA